ncbi:crustapain-like [Eupeodes corollae]|uniref:crustapain-like n=1 Tax=Eupeodes corollae TaxID=290404 RepID=UPI0024939E12|nr:crustapain-like [Eupeodes corollae]
MKFQLFKVLLIIASVFAFTYATSCTDDDWMSFKEKYKKTYKSPEDESNHQKTFCENIKTIDEHNELYERGATTYALGVSQFADMTSEEVSSFFNG